MLIIAIPKSASTSLVATLGKIHNMEFNQLMFPGLEKPAGYSCLPNYHSDIRVHPACLLKLYCESSVFFKQHIPPTEDHKHHLSNQRKVILLRRSEEVIDAYRRAEIRKIHTPRAEFEGIHGEAAWRDKAEEVGLKADLDNFYDGWMNSNDSHTLIIHSSELIDEPGETIHRVERFFNLPITTDPVILEKERYSRNSQSRGIWTRLLRAGKAAYRTFHS